MIIKVNDTISLEMIEEKHAEPIFLLVNVNRPHLRNWLPWVDHMLTIENFKDFVVKSKQQYHKRTDWAFVILINNVVAGRLGIYNIDQQNKIGSIGYWVGHNYQGKGIITKACKALITYGFSVMDLNRLEIKCGTENYKSQAIPVRLNFKKEGILRQGEFLYDKFIDLYLYSMLKNDWNTEHL